MCGAGRNALPPERNSVTRTLAVAMITALVCSALVTTAAIGLKPAQERNQRLNRQANILAVAGLLDPGRSVEDQFQVIETRIVELSSGEYAQDIDVASFDARRAASDPSASISLPPDRDPARIKRQAKHAPVYLVQDGGEVRLVILPIHGAGLWSTMRGFLALEADGRTIRTLKFHDHAETPGLGDQVDRPRWQALWEGKLAYDAAGRPQIEVIRGRVAPGDNHEPPRAGDPIFQVDGLSGATLTGRSVTVMVRFWLGPDGYGPYLKRHFLEAT